ncbi:MAG: glycosyltransferase [Roseiflexaceae bacterium]|nr:glycosyltransferase [Roseiflexaceae bacterium]
MQLSLTRQVAAKPRVLIIILCYNGIADTLACLELLRHVEYPSFDILVLDNASGDGTPEAVRAQFPHVTVIENGANLGFAAGNNVGSALCAAPRIRLCSAAQQRYRSSAGFPDAPD